MLTRAFAAGQRSSLMKDISIPDLPRNPYFSCRIRPSIFIREIRRHSPIVDLSQLNFVTRAHQRTRSTLLPRLSPIKFHSKGKIDRPSRSASRFDSCDVFRFAIKKAGNDTIDFSYIKYSSYPITRQKNCIIVRATIVYFKCCSLCRGLCAGFNRCFTHSWHSPNHFIISLFESFRSGCI